MSRIPSGVFIRTFLIITVLVGAICLQSEGSYTFSTHDKAFYMSANVINFVRPGLVFKVASAQIAQDGTITARVLVTDPQGIPLDKDGINSPGAVSISLCAAAIPKGQKQYTSYTTRTQTSPITKQSAIQAAADSGGTFTKNADGDYTYTFKTKAPAGFDANATHTIGIYGSRNLNDFNLGTNLALVRQSGWRNEQSTGYRPYKLAISSWSARVQFGHRSVGAPRRHTGADRSGQV